LADYRAKIQRKHQAVLQPGERVLATARAAAEGSPLAALGGLTTLLVVSAEARSQANAQGFPASMQMLLAVTDRRLLVFRTSALLRRHGLRGEVPFEALRDVSLERRGLSPRLRFVLLSGAVITFTTYRLDHPDEFVRVLNDAREARIPGGPPFPPPPTMAVVVPPPPPF
jgi:hypothetical protein